ncbi:hypothetical protein WJX73_010294 [Symbiochloris irregularis]|uniref:Uncharacterized protein n=1 Tax=Symbiochloris irregularis TaxID=706552 RepID=A0AAW1NR18_9CHLO
MESQRPHKRHRASRLYADEEVSPAIEPGGHLQQPSADAEKAQGPGVQLDEEPDGNFSVGSDTQIALQLLRSQFPRSAKASVPLLLRSQVYSLLHDHTAADRDLDSLRLSNKIRVFKLPSTIDDYAYTFTADYSGCITALLQGPAHQVPMQHPDGDDKESGLSAGPPVQPESMKQALAWFHKGVVFKCREIQLPHADLLRLLSSQSKKEAAEVTHAHVQALLSTGLLARSSSGGFNFAIPNAGGVIKAVTGARKELLGFFKRRRYPEVPLAALH